MGTYNKEYDYCEDETDWRCYDDCENWKYMIMPCEQRLKEKCSWASGDAMAELNCRIRWDCVEPKQTEEDWFREGANEIGEDAMRYLGILNNATDAIYDDFFVWHMPEGTNEDNYWKPRAECEQRCMDEAAERDEWLTKQTVSF